MLIDGWLNDVFDVNCMLPVFLHEELTRSSGMEKINHSNGWWTDKGAEATIFLVKVKKQPMVVTKNVPTTYDCRERCCQSVFCCLQIGFHHSVELKAIFCTDFSPETCISLSILIMELSSPFSCCRNTTLNEHIVLMVIKIIASRARYWDKNPLIVWAATAGILGYEYACGEG